MSRPILTTALSALLTAITTTAGCNTASAREVYVDANAAGAQKGTKAAPYKSLKEALSRCGSGSTLRVAAGTYRGDLTIKGRQITMLGGFGAGFAGRDPAQNKTVLSGTGKDAVLTLIDAGKTTIDGFVIKGGGGKLSKSALLGGGVYISGGDVTISTCVIEKNKTTRAKRDLRLGGGIFARGGSLTLRDSVIRHNTSERGGGISMMEQRRARIIGNRIEHNVGIGDHGGGLYVQCNDLLLEKNVLRKNEIGRKIGWGWGGALCLVTKTSRARLTRNYVTENFAAGKGSGYFIDDESSAVIEDELIMANSCAENGGSAIFVDGLSKGKGTTIKVTRSTIINHPCGGAAAGNALHVNLSSKAEIVDSVLINNGKKPVSAAEGSSFTIKRSLIDDRQIKGDKLVYDKPTFIAPEKGDVRLKALVGGIKPGVSWSLPSLLRRATKGASAAPPQREVKAADRSTPKTASTAKTKQQDCSVGGPRDLRFPPPLAALLLLHLLGRRRRRSRTEAPRAV